MERREVLKTLGLTVAGLAVGAGTLSAVEPGVRGVSMVEGPHVAALPWRAGSGHFLPLSYDWPDVMVFREYGFSMPNQKVMDRIVFRAEPDVWRSFDIAEAWVHQVDAAGVQKYRLQWHESEQGWKSVHTPVRIDDFGRDSLLVEPGTQTYFKLRATRTDGQVLEWWIMSEPNQRVVVERRT